MAVQRSLEALTLALDAIIAAAGEEIQNVYRYAKNTSGGAVTTGQVVRWAGSVGATDIPEFKLAKADAAATMPAVGIVHTGGADGDLCKILCFGVLTGIDTSALTEGAPIFVSAATAGSYTVTIPLSPYVTQLIGVVLRKHATTGSIFIAPLNQIPTQESWIAPTLLNSWVNYGGSYSIAGYYKDTLGTVHMRGLVKDGTAPGAVICTLPAGYRPGYPVVVPGLTSASALCDLRVSTTGDVSAFAGGSTTWLSLDSIQFRVV
jgi:hypothetical protein